MKKILGLDLGTTSIGWAYVHEAETIEENSEIIKLGVRVIPLSTDEEQDFQKGKSMTINADRTLKRSMRRNLDRYQLRRTALKNILKKYDFITEDTCFSEDGSSKHSSYQTRAKAVHERISREGFAKVLLMLNKKRGYKSSRKAKTDDDGTAGDGMSIALELHERNITPGYFLYEKAKAGFKGNPEFYRSDLQNEFDKIWEIQKQHYPDILNDNLKRQLLDKNKTQTWAICKTPFNIVGIKLDGKLIDQKIEKLKLRFTALTEKIDLERLAIVFQEINNQKAQSSGYLGDISDRSKELYFNNLTVGEYLNKLIKRDPQARLKNLAFYRLDYLDEFEKIWEKQKQYYPELNNELKTEIRDIIIFYQRRLKSQKHLISECEFEKYHKVIPKSSPLFQIYKIWSYLNNIELKHLPSRRVIKNNEIPLEAKQLLFEELNIRAKMTAAEILKILVTNPKEYELNYKNGLDGNTTNSALYSIYHEILELENKEDALNFSTAPEINLTIAAKFAEIGIPQELLLLNTDLEKNEFDKQPLMQLWHLLYSFEGDNSGSGVEKLIIALENKFGFNKEYSKLISKLTLIPDYGSLSAKAIRKILPNLVEGNSYDIACVYAGYNHSSSLNKEEREKRELKDTMELLKKNSLRNPVVEKILNQLVNVVNAIILDDKLGKPDEIRIELARDLKKNKAERESATSSLNKANIESQKIQKELLKVYPFNTGVRITKNDIVKYKLYLELEPLGFHTIYTNTYIPLEKLFSKEFDIEHIIPRSMLFDDSYSNKTLATRDFNSREKSNKTGIDAIIDKYGENSEDYNRYIKNADLLFKLNKISKSKLNKLLMKSSHLPDGFIERDLRNSQYIAKKAKQMLEDVARTVNTTTGSVTSRLREDWQLINVLQELNWEKYQKLGLTTYELSKDGQRVPKITDWTKRNDHRHHAMDALTVAFTRYEHVQYLNNMSARKNDKHQKYHEVYGIEQKYLSNQNGKFIFNPPMPINQLRADAKRHLESILVSFKAKNKVVTRNINKIKVKGKDKYLSKIELTPRGQLHKETIYGRITRYDTKYEKVGVSFDFEKINTVANKKTREALFSRLNEYDGDAKKAFGGKNSPSKNPIYLDSTNTVMPEKVKLVSPISEYTTRKEISPDLKIEKVIDKKIQKILQARLEEFGGDAKKAFVNLTENPIWLSETKRIPITRVTISGVNNVEALHYKKDHNGNDILDSKGNKLPVDFVSTGNNHHVAIYKHENGILHEEVVSFFEAVARVNAGVPIVQKEHPIHPTWLFQFTMKQNEYFVFPSDSFNPLEIDLLNQDNAQLISPNLFRVQKLTNGDYFFRHHLETKIEDKSDLKNHTYKRLGLNGIYGVVKVRINHLGKITKVGDS